MIGTARAPRLAARRLAPLALVAALPLLAEMKPGFRDLRWGAAPTRDMSLKETQGDLLVYQRKTDKLSVGEARLTSLSYLFYKDRLLGVLLIAPAASSGGLKTILTEQWSAPDQPNKFIESYRWSSTDPVLGQTVATMDVTPTGTHVTILGSRIKDEMDADRRAAARKAKDDL